MLDGASLGESQARLTRLLMPQHNPTSRLTQNSSTQGEELAAQLLLRRACAHSRTHLNAHTLSFPYSIILLLSC